MRAWYRDNCKWCEANTLTEALGLSKVIKGSIAVVGAGGKTSTIFRLAEEFATRGLSVIITTTTRMFRKPGALATTTAQVRELIEHQSIVIAGRPAEEGKIAGLEEAQYRALTQIADIVLVEADGSKHLPLKVPALHEPVVPSDVARIIIVSGLSGIGRKVSEGCHRAELAGDLLKVAPDHIIRPEDVARLIQKGYLEQRVPEGVQVIILLNQADDAGLCRKGEEVAKFLEPNSCVIARLKGE
jgi:probable selenium-dependent hydroxylase accessory protein YqeC